MRETFEHYNFKGGSRELIDQANDIVTEYRRQGFSLTLRQLYYQFVARGLIENTMRSYKRIGNVVSKARLAGEMDWKAIEDRTRNLEENPHWSSPGSIIRASADSFALDKWSDQGCRIEVWIEKEALIGVIEPICEELDIDYFACRGYVSQSEQYKAGKRFQKYVASGQDVVIVHLGDHDPSGIDMTRDIERRLEMFSYQGAPNLEVVRIALNMDQVEEFGPPPNPTKLTDSRAPDYIDRYGYESWELDALTPNVIQGLIRDEVEDRRDDELYERRELKQADAIERLEQCADRWAEVVDFLEETA